MKREQGSAMVLVLVMTVAITSIIVASGGLTENAINIVSMKQSEKQARYAVDGTNLHNLTKVKGGTMAVTPAFAAVDTEPTADETVNAVVVENTATITGSVKTTGSYRVREKTYSYTDVYGCRKTPKPNYYALFVNSATSLTKTLTTGAAGVNGDVWVNGNFSLSATGNQINGDLEAAGTVTAASLTVSETKWESAPALTLPGLNRASYQSAAVQTFSGNQTFAGFTFSSAYRLVYVNGDVKLTGTITGTGTIYATGKIAVDANTSYGTAGSRIALIAENDIDVASAASSFVGYFFTLKRWKIVGTGAHSLTSGGIVCSTFETDGPLTIIHDPTVWTDDTEGNRLKLPGYWP